MAIPNAPSGEMPFLDHLEELRWRIIYALGAVLVGVGLGFFLATKIDVVGVLAQLLGELGQARAEAVRRTIE